MRCKKEKGLKKRGTQKGSRKEKAERKRLKARTGRQKKEIEKKLEIKEGANLCIGRVLSQIMWKAIKQRERHV